MDDGPFNTEPQRYIRQVNMTHRLFYLLLPTVLMTTGIAVPNVALPSQTFQLAKKDKKPPAALVTEVALLKENLANTWFYTLRGQLKNQSDATILTPLVYYEIYSETTDKIIDAGTAVIEPKVLPAGEMGSFQQDLNAAGKVRITLVQWQQTDKAVKSHKQMQFFPLEAETASTEKGQN
ncbi:hypothetical protein [Acaryochloris sp. IP29b_bin.137]|uniref:hypothetical protein n=1 Tax=Acaryochloris sp. IP29b_bin.137 TaxID=2969217 RepID=UPI00261575A9|nr:hypothetical protein [Acaryochloris sp. IP29b_bin.137]